MLQVSHLYTNPRCLLLFQNVSLVWIFSVAKHHKKSWKKTRKKRRKFTATAGKCTLPYMTRSYKQLLEKYAQSAGFEPARAEPNGFLVHRLNHSATTATYFQESCLCSGINIFLVSLNFTLLLFDRNFSIVVAAV